MCDQNGTDNCEFTVKCSLKYLFKNFSLFLNIKILRIMMPAMIALPGIEPLSIGFIINYFLCNCEVSDALP